MSDKMEWLDDAQAPSKGETAPIVEPKATETASPASPQQTTDTPAPLQTATPEPAKALEHVPLATFLQQRSDFDAVKRELEEMRRRFEETTRQQQPEIDPLTDPQGFRREMQSAVHKATEDNTFALTHMLAVDKYGADAVAAAEQWLAQEHQQNPSLFQTVRAQRNPYDFLVKQHKRALSLAKLGDDDPDAWFEKQFKARIEKDGYVIPQARDASGQFVAAAPPQQPATLPKPSLASAPAASGNAPKTPIGAGVAFNEAF